MGTQIELLQRYQEEKEHILYLMSLEEKGFIIPQNTKYPNLIKILNDYISLQEEYLDDVDETYQNFMETLYKNIFDKDKETNSTDLYSAHKEIYTGVNIVITAIDNFTSTIQNDFNIEYVIENEVVNPFFYYYGGISYDEIDEIIPNYKINIIDLEKCLDSYYTEYILLSLNSINGYLRYKAVPKPLLSNYDQCMLYVYTEYVQLLWNDKVKNNLYNLITKFYFDLSYLSKSINKYILHLSNTYTRADVELDNMFLTVYDYNIYIPKTISQMFKIYSNADVLKSKYIKYNKTFNDWYDTINYMLEKWKDRYINFPDTYNTMWKRLQTT